MKKKRISRVLSFLLSVVMIISVVPMSTLSVFAATNEEIIYDYLTGTLGLNTAAACGVLANIEAESNFKTGEFGDGGKSYGICQWYDTRCTSLKNYCSKNGYDWKTLTGQLNYLKYELNNGYKSTYNYLKSVSNTEQGAYDAAHYWCYHFEIPADIANRAASRGKTAKDKYWKKYNKQSNTEEVKKEDAQYAILPIRKISITQKAGGSYSHRGTKNVDFGQSQNLYAPFDCKVVKILNKVRDNGNQVVIESLKKVYYADGTYDYMNLVVAHDNDISDMYVGKTIKQGEVFYHTGTYGNVTGEHVHMCVSKGKYAGHYQNSYKKWELKNSILPSEAFFIDGNTTIIEGGGYEWKKLTEIKPSVPKATISASGEVPQDTVVTISWSGVQYANGYRVYCNKSKIYDGDKTFVTYKLEEAINYSFYVEAYNTKYTSNKSETFSIVAKAPLTVTFEDWDGTILSTQMVAYNSNVVLASETPSREGYTFVGWDKSLNNIKEDCIITATYSINFYNIDFVDASGTKLTETQKVSYGSSAIPPSDKNVPTGYEFVGWSSENYINVKSNETIQAIYSWSNEELPIVTEITSAKRQEDGYYVYFNLINYPLGITRGRAIVSLKTAEGKLVETTESAAFSIPSAGTKSNMEVFIPCEESASVVEVIVVNSYSSGVPISKSVTSTVDQGLAWSEWSDTAPAEGSYSEMETRTVYRYRDKEFTTASTPTKEGWTNYDSSWEWSPYGNWSSWSRTPQTKSDTRDVATQTVTDKAEYKQYNYWRYYQVGGNHLHFCPIQGKNIYGGTWKRAETGWVSANIAAENRGQYHMYSNCSCGMKEGEEAKKYTYNGEIYYHKETKTVPAVTHTEYKYRDRSKIYTYYFYRWLDWSEWSTESVTQTDSREVDTPKTQYRYRNEFEDAGIEDTNGILRKASTNPEGLTENDILLPSLENCAGQEITLFIFKIDEASDWTNEFVGQSVVNDDGSYNFSFKLREEPSIKTGDFTVAIGIEGTTNTIIVGSIKAPKPEYTVVFRDWNGKIIDTQKVAEGNNATIPTLPEREGYSFVGWTSSNVNVRNNMDIEPIYVINKYTIIFVDWISQTLEIKEFTYGEIITPPEIIPVEGYDFIGWSRMVDGETVATESTVITAEYAKKTFVVTFYDYDSRIISEEVVEYGDNPTIPDALVKANYVFTGWKEASDEDMAGISSELYIYPEYIFKETVETPYADLETGVYEQTQIVSLGCDDENALIYFTTDGTDPSTSMTARKYETPITIDRSVELKFVASAFEKNNSETVSKVYAINSENTVSDWMLASELPQYVLDDVADYNMESEAGYRYKDKIVTSTTSEIIALEEDGWTNEGYEYGDQSEYQLSIPEFTDTEYEIIEQKPPQVEETHYKYTHFKYYDSTAEKYTYSPTEIDGVEGVSEEYVSPTRLSVAGFISGTSTPYYTYNNELWYNQEAVTVLVDPGYMMYAYKLKNYTLTKWTDWTTEAPSGGETRETEAETVFRFTAPKMAVVSVKTQNETISSLGIIGKTLNISADDYCIDGYEVTGFYSEPELINLWDMENAVLTGNIVLYPKYEKKKYNVCFKYENGEIISEQIVEYGGSAEVPNVEVDNGFAFVKWDTNDYNNVFEDLIVTAIIKPESEVTKITLSRNKYTTMAGSSFLLVAIVKPEDLSDKKVSWTSDNYSVADVDSNGIVTGVSAGTATITATAFDGTSVSCIITVLRNPDNELTPISSSTLVIDSSGYLRNILILTDEKTGTHTADTVANIKNQFINDNIIVVDINGKTLSDEDHVGTGSVVMLVDGETVVDSITIVVTGDFNGDGLINNRDASMITRYLVDKEEASLYQMLAIDVNGDGYVNNRDAAMVSRYLVGKEQL